MLMNAFLYKQLYCSPWLLTGIPALHVESANQLHSLALLALNAMDRTGYLVLHR